MATLMDQWHFLCDCTSQISLMHFCLSSSHCFQYSSLLRSPDPCLLNDFLFISVFLLTKALWVPTSQLCDHMHICLTSPWSCFIFAATLHWSHSASFTQHPWQAYSWNFPRYRVSFFYPLKKKTNLAPLEYLYLPFISSLNFRRLLAPGT